MLVAKVNCVEILSTTASGWKWKGENLWGVRPNWESSTFDSLILHISLSKPATLKRYEQHKQSYAGPYVGSTLAAFHILIIRIHSRFHAVWISTFARSQPNYNENIRHRHYAPASFTFSAFLIILFLSTSSVIYGTNFIANENVSFPSQSMKASLLSVVWEFPLGWVTWSDSLRYSRESSTPDVAQKLISRLNFKRDEMQNKKKVKKFSCLVLNAKLSASWKLFVFFQLFSESDFSSICTWDS